MLVGNKIDLGDRQVSKATGRDFAKRNSMLFVETSARTSENITQCFEELVSKVRPFIFIRLSCIDEVPQ